MALPDLSCPLSNPSACALAAPDVRTGSASQHIPDESWHQLLCSDVSLNFTGCSLGIVFIGNHGESSPFSRVGGYGKKEASNSNHPRSRQEVSPAFLSNLSVDHPLAVE